MTPLLLILTHGLTLHGLITLAALLVYVLRTRVTRQRRHPMASVAWILFILLLPYLALPAFLLFGSRKLSRPAAPPVPAPAPATSHPLSLPTPPGTAPPWLEATFQALQQPAAASVTGLSLHADGAAARRALMTGIDAARGSIDLCTFILRPDALGREVMARLVQRARDGVRVRVLLDGLGLWMGGWRGGWRHRRRDLDALRQAGVQVEVFVPPLRSPLRGRTNLRNHRKLVIVDAGRQDAWVWCGGRNLGSEYFDGEPGVAPWIDLSFDARGSLVGQAALLFEHDWAFAANDGAAALQAARRLRLESDEGASAPQTDAPAPPPLARLIASGPDQPDDTLYTLMVSATYRAERRILMATPYFVPDPELLLALTLAARRGVRVRLLLPERSNHRLSDLARARSLRALAQAGGEIGLLPRMLHAKLAVFDDLLALSGSANLDSRSLFLNYELMVGFQDGGDIQRHAQWFEAQAAGAAAYEARRPGLMRDLAEGMVLAVAFQL